MRCRRIILGKFVFCFLSSQSFVVICGRAVGEHVSTAAYVPAVDPKRHVDKALVRKGCAPRVLRVQLGEETALVKAYLGEWLGKTTQPRAK